VVRRLHCDGLGGAAVAAQDKECVVLSAKKFRSFIAAITFLAAPLAMQACASDGDAPSADDDDGGPSTGPEENTNGDGICLMNNCNDDEQCAGCADDRTSCLLAENRCVACDPVTGAGCADGMACTPFGICAPAGQVCPSDDHGDPTITCTQNSDCLACSPMHQVCDTTVGQCQACTGSNTQHCLASDICVDGTCSSKCPSSCTVDNDCGQCGAPGNETHACNNHKCAECSETWPCAAGLECLAGSCVPGCGTPGTSSSGGCLADSDCEYCGDPDGSTPNNWDCKKPINANGANDHGTCTPVANGCSDLGSQVAVLPSPWGDVTNLCSNDADCAGTGILFDVGQLVKDIIGDDELNLGFTKLTIQQANVTYQMNKCADIDITNNISCGVCVPCMQDSDCAPIAIDPVIWDMFSGEPLAQIGGALLINLLFGDSNEHNLNFHCQPVAAGYGICAPCSNPLQACGTNQGSSQGGGGGGGSCSHDTSTTGGPLNASCSTCAATVCASDSFCCNNSWDSLCVSTAASLCGSSQGGGGGGSCAHSECVSGGALGTGCSSCATTVCNADSFCCNSSWDGLCVTQAEQLCGSTCGASAPPPPGPTCAHAECSQGTPLDANCSSCAATVCGIDNYCCATSWDGICVDIASANCGGCN
jgi:hypothetical protein